MSQSTSETKPLYSSFGDDPDLGEIVQMFVEEMPDRIATLLDQLQASDWEGLRRTAHQLKGAAGSYGFDVLTDTAADLESHVRQGDPETQIHAAVEELVDMCRRLRDGTPTQ